VSGIELVKCSASAFKFEFKLNKNKKTLFMLIFSARNCPILDKVRNGQIVRRPLSGAVTTFIKTEDVRSHSPVVIKDDIDAPSSAMQVTANAPFIPVQVKSEPMDVDSIETKPNSTVHVNIQPTWSTEPPHFKVEPVTIVGSHVTQHDLSSGISDSTVVAQKQPVSLLPLNVIEQNIPKPENPIPVEVSLNKNWEYPDACGDDDSDTSWSESDSGSDSELPVNARNVEMISSVAGGQIVNRMAKRKLASEGSKDNGSKVRVKQELNDSDDEDAETGEYMVLAEWTDGKLEELGSGAQQDDEDGPNNKKHKSCKLFQGLF